MSRIGKKKINIPEGVEVTTADREIKIAGSSGEQTFRLPQGISASIAENQISVNRDGDSKSLRSLQGTANRIIKNMVDGISAGFSKKLQYKGVGFTAVVAGEELQMRLGFSHPIIVPIPKSLKVTVLKNTINIEGAKKEEVGAFAAKIRAIKKPEVYKGKGIKYEDEFIKRKAGKAAQTTTT